MERHPTNQKQTNHKIGRNEPDDEEEWGEEELTAARQPSGGKRLARPFASGSMKGTEEGSTSDPAGAETGGKATHRMLVVAGENGTEGEEAKEHERRPTGALEQGECLSTSDGPDRDGEAGEQGDDNPVGEGVGEYGDEGATGTRSKAD
jgi:hypothetical protein